MGEIKGTTIRFKYLWPIVTCQCIGITILRNCVQGNKLQKSLGCNSCGSLFMHTKGPKCRKFHSIYADPISMTSQQCLIVGKTPCCSVLNCVWECIIYTELHSQGVCKSVRFNGKLSKHCIRIYLKINPIVIYRNYFQFF